ncbi:MAG TPA: cytochrome c oxidase assembly protein [Steroidobacteraceae bacterium]|nr:cytochrome c oxidase assembly protein [Steroidobacteraceae bacterium]
MEDPLVRWLLPWEPSPVIILLCAAGVALYARGSNHPRVPAAARSGWRAVSFYLGLALIYAALQTRFDYLAQHMFWIHRLQHLVLHHIGPVLVCLAAPWQSIAAGVPVQWQAGARRIVGSRPVRLAYDTLQQPLVAFVLFNGLIYFWLWPSIHFRAMLSLREYECMNWSMAADGLLFWWLMLDPRSREQGARMAFGIRIVVVLLAMGPQLAIGAYLSLHRGTLYDVYAVCGRLWPIVPATDQEIGGLITWIPASMMSVVVGLVLWQRWIRNDDRVRAPLGRAAAASGPIERPLS